MSELFVDLMYVCMTSYEKTEVCVDMEIFLKHTDATMNVRSSKHKEPRIRKPTRKLVHALCRPIISPTRNLSDLIYPIFAEATSPSSILLPRVSSQQAPITSALRLVTQTALPKAPCDVHSRTCAH